jgi:hypothetical protein
MTKNEIIYSIDQAYSDLFSWLDKHGETFWEKGPEGKWNTGQQIKHLCQSAKPLNRALKIPKFLLRYKFGKANRPSRTKEKIIHRYHERLSMNQNVVSPFSQDMSIPTTEKRDQLISQLRSLYKSQVNALNKKWDAKSLDKYIVPHPLMGKMTIREINIWSAYHVEHHLRSIQSNCENL